MTQLPPRKSFEYRSYNADTAVWDNAIVYECPCCQYPTLSEVGEYFICRLCGWEDDNDDGDFGGPNGAYTLQQARRNFRTHWIMCDREEVAPHEAIKKAAVAVLQQFMEENDPTQRGKLMSQYYEIVRKL